MTEHDRTALSPVKQALLEIRDLRQQLDELRRRSNEPAAIVGMACRLPGGIATLDQFWDLLSRGENAITPIPASRWNLDDFFAEDPDAPGKMYSRHGGFVDDVRRFDAAFFGISPREAASMDPQQRLLLEVCWHALEDAGLAANGLIGSRGGVFIGASNTDYHRLVFADTDAIDAYASTGTTLSVAAGRLSYHLGLQGPSLVVDTACSSSLVALHMALHSLHAGECDFAIVGGVNVILSPDLNVNFSKARMMAPDGRCKTFDAAADGYVRGEGCGVVVLKRASDAALAKDRVRAIVRGSAVNQDGRSSGLTVPNGPAQEAVIRAALNRAGVKAAEVDYVEAHGTGTALGDPIEVGAVAAALGAGRDPGKPLVLGSVKTNLGHLEAAAGIVGLIKVVLALEHQQIPAQLHFQRGNPHVPWSELPVTVAQAPIDWPASVPRVAGVSSFGFSGTNAHVILASAPAAPEAPTATDSGATHVVALSGRTLSALNASAARVADYLSAHPDVTLADASFTAATGRVHFAHRLAFETNDRQDAIARLRTFANSGSAARDIEATTVAPSTAFLFAGHGAQYVGMGRGLYRSSKRFRESLDRCAEVVGDLLDRPLLDVMFDRDGLGSRLAETVYAQASLFALQVALADLWRSWGVEPAAVAGHSLGDDIAACVAGVWPVEVALPLVVTRARLIEELTEPGRMLAVFADEASIAQYLPATARLSVAAVNGPEHVVVSGAAADMEALSERFQRAGVKTRWIKARSGFHSPLMEPALDAYEAAVAAVQLRRPEIPVVSSLLGTVAPPAELMSPAHWRRHLRGSVRFDRSVAALYDLGCRLFIEVGPNGVVTSMGKRCLPHDDILWLSSLNQQTEDWPRLMSAVAQLYVRGLDFDWRAVRADTPGSCVALPGYPFEGGEHWISRQPQTIDAAARWEKCLSAGSAAAATGPIDLALDTFPAKWRALEDVTTAFVVETLRQLDAVKAGEEISVDSFMQRFGVPAHYRLLIGRWFTRLESAGVLRRQGRGWVSPSGLPASGLSEAVAAVDDSFENYRAFADYVVQSGRLLPEIVTGRESALQTLFPDGSFELARGIYETSVVARYFNGIVAGAVRGFAQFTPGSRKLRVLEIGAGTGGTTGSVVSALSPDQSEYVFTDMSELFLDRARQKFAGAPFVRYELLDIDAELDEARFGRHAFDLVVAANVLHASRDLRQTLQRVKRALAPGGVAVLLETTRHPSWFDISTGLIEGWQVFADGIRDDNPLIPAPRWLELLAEAGFEAAERWPRPDSPAEILGQHVIVALAPLAADAVRVVAPATSSAAPAKPVAAAVGLDGVMALRPEARRAALLDYVRATIRRVLRLPDEEPLAADQRLMDLGLDSLMAVDLRNQLESGAGLPARSLPATLVFDHPTIGAVATLLERSLKGTADDPVEATPATGRSATASAPAATDEAAIAVAIGELSDEEAEARLLRKLETL